MRAASSSPCASLPGLLPSSFLAAVALTLRGWCSGRIGAEYIPPPGRTYAYVASPTYETPARGRFLRAAGTDTLGMSTIPEVPATREAGIELVVLSLVSNKLVIGSNESAREAEEVAGEVRFPAWDWR